MVYVRSNLHRRKTFNKFSFFATHKAFNLYFNLADYQLQVNSLLSKKFVNY